MADSLTYPFKTMRITQHYNGRTSHYDHSHGVPCDYPIDEGGGDGGRDPMYCPCAAMTVRRIWGVGSGGVNTVWLESCAPVLFADGTSDYAVLLAMHPNDDDLQKLRVGQVLRRGDVICREGSDGGVGNHIHLSVGRGRFTGSGWVKNNRGKWVLTAAGGACKPENAFFLDPAVTTVLSAGGLSFCRLKQTRSSLFRVTAPLLRVRTGPGTTYAHKPFSALSADAKAQILALANEKRDGYVKGVVFAAREISGDWAKTASGWVCLRYCEACA